MTSFEEADNNGSGSIEKHEWDLLLLDDKRRRIEDEDAHRDQTRKMAWFALWGMLLYPFAVVFTSASVLTTLRQLSAAWPLFILCQLLGSYLSLWV
tara:strand:- start:128 stop:415 length:288 start_codon:yes stop_codon:yes gene_type:complete